MSEVVWFFSGWEALGRIAVVGTAMYVALVLMLRIAGSRALASLNAFDFIVTVAIGSAFGRALTAKGVALAEAVAAFALLVGLQFAVAWLQTRSRAFERTVTNPPTLLYYRGEPLRDAMSRHRVTESEIRAAVRKHRLGSFDEVEAVVLEPTGSLSVIVRLGDGTALEDGMGPA